MLTRHLQAGPEYNLEPKCSNDTYYTCVYSAELVEASSLLGSGYALEPELPGDEGPKWHKYNFEVFIHNNIAQWFRIHKCGQNHL